MPSSLHKLGVQLESRDDTANVFLTCLGDEISYYDGERQGEIISSHHFQRELDHTQQEKDPHIEMWWDVNVCEDPRFVIFITPDSSRDDWAYYVLFMMQLAWTDARYASKARSSTSQLHHRDAIKGIPLFVLFPHICRKFLFRVTVSKGAPTSYKKDYLSTGG